MRRSALVAAIISGTAFNAYAAPDPERESETAVASEMPSACGPGVWDLSGADWRVGEDCTFSDAWRPVLEDVVACLAHPLMERACVQLQGQFDETSFTPEIVRVYGTMDAAQDERARSRSSRVGTELMELGVPGVRVKELPPGEEGTYRGVHVKIVTDCVEPTDIPGNVVTHDELEPAVRAAVGEEIDARVAFVGPEPTGGLVLRRPDEGFFTGGLAGSLASSQTDAVLASVLQAGGGWSNGLWYGFGDLGLELGSPAEERIGFEAAVRGGYVSQTWDWLELGFAGGVRLASSGGGTPWLDQIWYLGLESSQCVLEWSDNAELCIRETVAPLALRTRRGVIEGGGDPRRIPTEREAAFRFDLALVLRYELFAN